MATDEVWISELNSFFSTQDYWIVAYDLVHVDTGELVKKDVVGHINWSTEEEAIKQGNHLASLSYSANVRVYRVSTTASRVI